MAAAAFGFAALLAAVAFAVGGSASMLLLGAAVIPLLLGAYLAGRRNGWTHGPDGSGYWGDGGGDGPG